MATYVYLGGGAFNWNPQDFVPFVAGSYTYNGVSYTHKYTVASALSGEVSVVESPESSSATLGWGNMILQGLPSAGLTLAIGDQQALLPTASAFSLAATGELLYNVDSGAVVLLSVYPAASGILINIPIEIDAGNFATALTVQGETVSYNHVHVPLEYQTVSADPTATNMAATFRWREDQADQTQVEVESNASAVGSYANGKAVVKALFKAALEGGDLRNVAMTAGIVYADDSARNTSTDPLKFYVSKDVHTAGTAVGSTLKAYLQEYLYDNLTKAIGLAATTGVVDITMSRDGSAASEIVAEALAEQLCGTSGSEQGVAALALRQNIYEQMFTLAPERFQESEYMRRDPAANSYFRPLPFQVGDTMAFLVTFKFPASQISAPVVQNAIRTGNANVYVDTGSKIQVAAPADTTATTRPQLSNFPDCTVMLRAKLMA